MFVIKRRIPIILRYAYLGLSGNRGNGAHFVAFESVDDAALSNIGISNEADRYLLFIGMKLRELSEKLNKGAFSEGVIRRSMECNSRIAGCEVLNITSLTTG